MSGATNCKEPSASSSPVSVVLTAEDIPGAALREPYESYAVPALRWWLLCRGIRVSTSQRKAQLISRLVIELNIFVELIQLFDNWSQKLKKGKEDGIRSESCVEANKVIIMLDLCNPEGLWLAGGSFEKVVFRF